MSLLPIRHHGPVTPPRSTARWVMVWRRTAATYGYLLTSLPFALGGLLVAGLCSAIGTALVVVWVGLPVLAVGLVAGRWFGTVELARLRAAGVRPVDPPAWPARRTSPRLALRATLVDSRHWAYLAHTLANGILGIATWTLALTWVGSAAGALTFWAWSPLTDHGRGSAFFQVAAFLVRSGGLGVPATLARDGVMLVLGVMAAALVPILGRVLMAAHCRLAAALLGERRSFQHERDAAQAEQSRRSAVIAEDAALRRLERDLHDGPQQHLVRIQYDLAIAANRIETDPAGAQTLIMQTLQRSKTVLDELRSLSRGLAPPILQDRGLAAALSSLADQSVMTVHARLDLGPSPLLAPIERSAYYVAAELLTNAVRHAHATRADLAAELATDADGRQYLRLTVGDDGIGGARTRPGHGLAGLEDRIAGLRGTLTIVSPPGGPTTITANIPVDRPAGTLG
ncbi:sensor domain-containing protein [Nocardioides sp. BP30]|uniref:sensor histidine kinase n=1 Tax=Nocardioides sp. BP30 TaxID=3036374 RepID=UPI0024690FC7|nr:sensor domain-containing protein [Nocardioides sp. BP30]WGL52457.1 sensor domain-containing protein [Nocardioides sp. BP30]